MNVTEAMDLKHYIVGVMSGSSGGSSRRVHSNALKVKNY